MAKAPKKTKAKATKTKPEVKVETPEVVEEVKVETPEVVEEVKVETPEEKPKEVEDLSEALVVFYRFSKKGFSFKRALQKTKALYEDFEVEAECYRDMKKA